MRLKIQQALYIYSPNRQKLLLLKRGSHKSMSGLHTGIGGHVELDEINNIELSVIRELEEETKITIDMIQELKYRGTFFSMNDHDTEYFMYVYTGVLSSLDNIDYSCDDGELIRYDLDDIVNLDLTNLTRAVVPYLSNKQVKRFGGIINRITGEVISSNHMGGEMLPHNS